MKDSSICAILGLRIVLMDGGQTTIDLGTSILKAKYLTKLVSTVAFL